MSSFTSEYSVAESPRGSSGSRTSLHELEEILVERLATEWRREIPSVLIRRAVREASETARTTDLPSLFLPELANEQVRRVAQALRGEAAPLVEAA